MIAELVKQYDTLKRCGIRLPDPYFAELPVSVEIQLKTDGSFDKATWLCMPREKGSKNKTTRQSKEEPILDIDCPVTERSACRSSGNDSPHGLVDNPSWIFGELAPETRKKKALSFTSKKNDTEDEKSPGEQRLDAYLAQLRAFYKTDTENLREVCFVYRAIRRPKLRSQIWSKVEQLLKDKIRSKGERVFDKDPEKWRMIASKANIRWAVQSIGGRGKAVHSLKPVKDVWSKLQEKQGSKKVISILDGQEVIPRILHPRIKGASLISFNDSATYCGHLHGRFSKKISSRGKEEDGSALPAQIGFEQAEKYSMALDWLITNSSVRFGESTNCIWIDQAEDINEKLNKSAHDLVAPQSQKSVFSRGKAKKNKGDVLGDSGDLIKAMQRFRNAQSAGYRKKRFYLLSMLLRNKGRHAILGGYSGTMGELEKNAYRFIEWSSVRLPPNYLVFKDEPRDFCPTLMDILDAAGVKSQKKKRLVWDREVIEAIVWGRPLPPDLCRLVVLKAIQQKHQEQSQEARLAYRELLAIAAGCARHYLNRITGKENYQMGLDTNITDPGYLAGRLFAVCENIQKRGRGWGKTLSDKLFSAGIERPRDALGQLYQNCLCYEIYRKDSDWFGEIFDKVKLKKGDNDRDVILPAQGVDAFEFLLGYWHQRSVLQTTSGKSGDDGQKEQAQINAERSES